MVSTVTPRGQFDFPRVEGSWRSPLLSPSHCQRKGRAMLRRVHLAPLGLAISFSSLAVVSGCNNDGATLSPPPPMAVGGTVVGSGGATVGNTSGGNTYAQGGQTSVGQGGSSTTTTTTAKGGTTGNGGVTGNGGTTVTGNGGTTVTGNGGTTTTTTTTAPAGGSSTVAQTCTTDLMTLREGTTNDWIVNTTGKSCGVQGSIFGFGDATSWVPPATPICTAGATGTCCISGTTVTDATFAKYGAGIGMDMNSSGGTTPVKSAYSGTAKGLKFTLTGTFPTGATMRVMYAPGATVPAQTDPYKEMPAAAGTYTVLFSDATCPTWATTGCPAASQTPYQFKIQLNGGGATGVGAYNFCLTSIIPST